jgi:hypothetical protein
MLSGFQRPRGLLELGGELRLPLREGALGPLPSLPARHRDLLLRVVLGVALQLLRPASQPVGRVLTRRDLGLLA